jgi:hypothetical protein
MRFALLLSVCTTLLLAPLAAAAQSAALAGVRGTITDAHGAPLHEVHVEIRDGATGRLAMGSTDRQGRYLISNLQAGGPYGISVQRLGYTKSRADSVQLVAGTVHRFDFVLSPTALALPAIEVRAATDARFGTERSGAATVVTRETVVRHPTIERNVMELTALSPMAARTTDGLAIAGQNSRFNAFQIDGGRYQDMFGTAADGAPGGRANARPLPIDAIEQFQVLVAPFDVRQSGFTGGLLNAVTRGGTNTWEAGGFAHYRNGSMLGSLHDPLQSTGADGFSNALAGFNFGGPLARDRAHIFAAVEVERRTTPASGYNLGSADAYAARIQPDSAARFATLLRDRFGMEPGAVGQMLLDNPRENVFIRADWQPTDRHRLMLRHNYAAARRDDAPERSAIGAYELGSTVYAHHATSNAATLQLVSSLRSRWSNELLLNVQRISDRAVAASDAPVIEVDVVSSFDTLRVARRLRAGGHYEAQSNATTQTGIELRNALTGGFGRHLLTVGGSAELLHFNSRYIANPQGRFTFSSLAALESNEAMQYERTLVAAGADAAARFNVTHFAAFVQDEWSAATGLTLHAGLRVDLPVLRERPDENTRLHEELGASTSMLPRAAPLWSPRVAFNWQSPWHYRTQLRGGAGLFAGRPAYSWLANAYAQTGLQTRILECTGNATPELHAAARPTTCRGGAETPNTRASAVTLFSRDFRYPQDLRFAGGFDQQLPFGLVATADFVLAIAQRQIFLRDINLLPFTGEKTDALGFTDGYGFHYREAFGVPSNFGFRTLRRSSEFAQVIELDDNADNRALAMSVELAGRTFGTSFNGSYTYTRSLDVQSLVHRDAATNYGRTATYLHPNNPTAVISDFDRPHKVLLSLSRRFLERRGGTELSLLYIGETGAPYSYVYTADINGDGFPGTGTQDTYNDLIFVPDLLPDYPGTLGSAAAFERMKQVDPCLAAWYGLIIDRNACRSPATHRLDLRAGQTIRIGSTELRLVADVLNVLDLLGSRYGRVERVSPLMPLLDVEIPRSVNPLTLSPERLPLMAWYGGPVAPGQDGRMRSLPPYTLDAAASRWQAQIGVEIRR